jgi:hypothetical protein
VVRTLVITDPLQVDAPGGSGELSPREPRDYSCRRGAGVLGQCHGRHDAAPTATKGASGDAPGRARERRRLAHGRAVCLRTRGRRRTRPSGALPGVAGRSSARHVMPIAPDHPSDEPGSELELTTWTRRTAWTNAKTRCHSAARRHTQQTTSTGFLVRSVDLATASHPLRGLAWENRSPPREHGSGDKTGDILPAVHLDLMDWLDELEDVNAGHSTASQAVDNRNQRLNPQVLGSNPRGRTAN